MDADVLQLMIPEMLPEMMLDEYHSNQGIMAGTYKNTDNINRDRDLPL
jgi:hypothetical protein